MQGGEQASGKPHDQVPVSGAGRLSASEEALAREASAITEMSEG